MRGFRRRRWRTLGSEDVGICREPYILRGRRLLASVAYDFNLFWYRSSTGRLLGHVLQDAIDMEWNSIYILAVNYGTNRWHISLVSTRLERFWTLDISPPTSEYQLHIELPLLLRNMRFCCPRFTMIQP